MLIDSKYFRLCPFSHKTTPIFIFFTILFLYSVQCQTVCNVPTCERNAAELSNDMDKSADPCDDFYQFTCGGYVEKKVIPPTESKIDKLLEIRDKQLLQIREIMETPPRVTDIKHMIYAKKIYQLCMYTEKLDVIGVRPLLEQLEEFGNWPMITFNYTEVFPTQWFDVYESMNRFMETGLIEMIALPDRKNGSRNLITFEEPLFFYKPGQEESYINLIVEVAKVFNESKPGPYVTEEQVRKDAEDIVELERKLYEISKSGQQFSEQKSMYNPMTIGEFQKLYDNLKPKSINSKIRWIRLLYNLFLPTNLRPTLNTVINVASLHYIKKLPEVLDSVAPRTLVNYLCWRYVFANMEYTSWELRKLAFQAKKIYDIEKEEEERWKYCLGVENMQTAISYAYVLNKYKSGTKDTVDMIMQDINREIELILDNSEWMDEATQDIAIEKLKNMKKYIGYPDWYTPKTIDEMYANFVLATTFFQNVMNLKRLTAHRAISSLETARDIRLWTMHPIDTVAVYKMFSNSVILTATVLHDNLVDFKRPVQMNYGALGFLMGYEVGRGFGQYGRLFDKEGSLKPWWSEKSINNYKNKTTCYDKYLTNDVDKRVGSEELMNDALAITAAYNAHEYRQFAVKGDQRLVGMEEYDKNKLFFISLGNFFCEKLRSQEMDLTQASRGLLHSLRLRVAVSNFKPFSDAFNCPLDSPMNPKEKCVMWSKA